MGSFQQITFGALCVGGAFWLGQYLNNHPRPDQVAQEWSDRASQPAAAKTSLLDPGTVLDASSGRFGESMFRSDAPAEKPLPPPSQLKSASDSRESSAKYQAETPVRSRISGSRPEIVLPDFSELAASFRDTPLELPSVAMSAPALSQRSSPYSQDRPLDLVSRSNPVRAPFVPFRSTAGHNESDTPVPADDRPGLSGPPVVRALGGGRVDDSIAPVLSDFVARTKESAPEFQERPRADLRRLDPPVADSESVTRRQMSVLNRQTMEKTMEMPVRRTRQHLRPRPPNSVVSLIDSPPLENAVGTLWNDSHRPLGEVPGSPHLADGGRQAEPIRRRRQFDGGDGWSAQDAPVVSERYVPRRAVPQNEPTPNEPTPNEYAQSAEPPTSAPIPVHRERWSSRAPSGSAGSAGSSGGYQRVAKPMVPFVLSDAERSKLVRVRRPMDRQTKIEATKFIDHVTNEGDTLPSLSMKYYGRPEFYLDIYMVNQDQLRNPADVPLGLTLKIPVYK